VCILHLEVCDCEPKYDKHILVSVILLCIFFFDKIPGGTPLKCIVYYPRFEPWAGALPAITVALGMGCVLTIPRPQCSQVPDGNNIQNIVFRNVPLLLSYIKS
jgi:hypothetical protein